GIYDELIQLFSNMGPTAIANAEYSVDFYRERYGDEWSTHFCYVDGESKEFNGNLFGEIMGEGHGTAVGAQGSHFFGNEKSSPNLLDDYTKTKCTIVLGCPSFASPAVSDLFYNQICTLSSIRDADKEEETHSNMVFVLKKSTSSDNGNSSSPGSLAKRNLKKHNHTTCDNDGTKEDEDIQPSVCTPVCVPSAPHQIHVGAEYDHRLMPDFGGPVFAMKKAKLIQPQWNNINNELIVPWENYKYLRPGTVVVATICFEVFVMPV
ncbi:hypothetical protein F5877DRAFT_5704, partial [Lentinula edodes]